MYDVYIYKRGHKPVKYRFRFYLIAELAAVVIKQFQQASGYLIAKAPYGDLLKMNGYCGM